MNPINSPQGQGTEFFQMNAPTNTSNKLDTVKLLEQGPNPGILYSMIDLGTHYNTYFKKSSRLIRLTFEFPLLKQLFRTTDTEVKSTVVSMEETFQISNKSNLKKFCDGALGRTLAPHEYSKGFNIGQFLGKVLIVTIVNRASKKDPEKIYNNISTVQALTEHSRQAYNFPWDMVIRTNPLIGFMIDPDGTCFQSDKFASLPDFLRERIMDSDEGKAYAERGGIFIAKKEYQDVAKTAFDVPSNAQVAVQRTPLAPPTGPPLATGRTLIMIDLSSTREAFNGSGWTDELLVEHGKAKWEEVLPPPPPPAPSQAAPLVPPPLDPPAPLAPPVDLSNDIPF